MSTNLFQAKLVNGYSGDPALWIHNSKSGEGILFDLGRIDNLTNKEILKTTLVCVSHAHIDHFIGFDRFLRVHIPHFRPMKFVGPPGIHKNIAGKLSGYLWNLLEPGQIKIEVFEVTSTAINKYVIVNDNSYDPALVSSTPVALSSQAPVVALSINGGAELSVALLDHGTPSVAFRLDAPESYRVKLDVIEGDGLMAGPWIAQAQSACSKGELDKLINIGPNKMTTGQIAARYFEKAKGQSLCYATDFEFSQPNIDAYQKFAAGSLCAWIDSSFADADHERAFRTKHLSTKQAAILAALAKVEQIEPFHFSSIYGESIETVKSEALNYFAEYRKVDLAETVAASRTELKRRDPPAE